jgi:hypothetical protein
MIVGLDKILKALPFNGKKTGIGLAISVIAIFFPDFPITEELGADLLNTITKIIELGGNAYLILGLLHKWIKTKV